MQELDYEELDKAVNSLMPSSQPSVTPAIAPVVPATAPSAPPAAPIASITPIERPSTGRFMDVVHPSSDMRSTLNTPQRPAMPIVNMDTRPTTTPPKPLISTPPASTYTSPVIAPAPNANTNNWAGLPNYQASNETPGTPFLSEAKVEKRPLGAFSDEVKTTPASSTVAPEPVETINSDIEPKKVSTDENNLNPELPDELNNSLLNVESDSSTHPDDINLSVNPLSQTPMTTSINQQYTEKPSSDNPNNGSIYDANSYHKVITRQPKKKSGWMWVLWIVILLIVGAGAGVAFYFFVMPNLPNF